MSSMVSMLFYVFLLGGYWSVEIRTFKIAKGISRFTSVIQTRGFSLTKLEFDTQNSSTFNVNRQLFYINLYLFNQHP